MRVLIRRVSVVAWLLGWTSIAAAQTADQIVEKTLTAVGGRAALMKLTSRIATGTITLSTPGGDIAGTIEIMAAVPNKSRTLIKADLSAFGAGQLVVDQRFDGKTGYVMDSLQGNRDITGNQLDNLRNSSFPNPFLNYKQLGMTVRLGDQEKVGDRAALVLIFEPTTGSVIRQYIDAETYLPIRLVVTVNVPQLGRDVEQTSELLDYRDVDGVKLPFKIEASSSVQSYSIAVTKVEHNKPIDDALFSKPPAP